ncbi:TetR/AcrR family transcriptional regulator [Rossellomorea sp. y25]|uniref:TetR/AcrR family transcriptional regulator n=1 Tax=Rossellomorea sp. y25 TaxID=3118174 RepID=UPI00262208A0|nr:TetR/AcrR family transcriptional regulator [uncultured Rossellomorea sp.]
MSKRKDKKERILKAAEQAFAHEGSNFSLRTVTEMAEVNVAAVNYYFGSKSQLIEELVEGISGELNKEQLRRLSELDQCQVSDIVEAFTTPFFLLYSNKADRKVKTAILGRLLIDTQAETRETFYQNTREIDAAYLEALKKRLPELSEEELYWRYRNMIGLIIHNLGKFIDLPDGNSSSLSDRELISRIVGFCSAGLSSSSGNDFKSMENNRH